MPDYQFIAVISGNATKLPYPDNVKVHYNIMNKLELEYLYKSASIYLNTSKHEGLPLTLLEAMKCGCIPICPNTGGISDLITGIGTVLSVSNKNKSYGENIPLYVKAIRQYENLDNEPLRKIIISKANDYTIDRMIRDWEAIYNENNEVREEGREG